MAKLDPEEQPEVFKELKEKAQRPKKKSTKSPTASKTTPKQKVAAVDDTAGKKAEESSASAVWDELLSRDSKVTAQFLIKELGEERAMALHKEMGQMLAKPGKSPRK